MHGYTFVVFRFSSLGRKNVYTVHVSVCVCLSVGFCFFILGLVWFALAFVIDATIKTAPHACAHAHTHTHGRMYLNDSLHPSQWLLIGQFLCRVNVMHFEKFCGAINTTQQNSSATFSIKYDTL